MAVRPASSVAVHVIGVIPIGNVLPDTRGPPPVSTQSTEAVPPALAASVAVGLKVTVAPVEAVACSSAGAVQAENTGAAVSIYFSFQLTRFSIISRRRTNILTKIFVKITFSIDTLFEKFSYCPRI